MKKRLQLNDYSIYMESHPTYQKVLSSALAFLCHLNLHVSAYRNECQQQHLVFMA